MSVGDRVNLIRGQTPKGYHCQCDYCCKVIGELRPSNGAYYSRLERREYYFGYTPEEKAQPEENRESGKKGHVAKTPLHIARWAVQKYTKPGDWVLDPTIGAGTTAVEALTQGRNVAGMELQFDKILKANVAKNLTNGVQAKIRIGDARTIASFLDELDLAFNLVVSNPPYSGDESDGGMGADHPLKDKYQYESNLPNLAFLKEGQAYWEALGGIYTACAARLAPGGHFVTGIKDMIRSRKPFMLHKDIADVLTRQIGLKFVGTAFLKHHPTTLHLNTYFKKTGCHPPYYQTISVFRKPG